MSIFKWNDSLSIGIPQIDADHQQLLSLLNRAYDEFVNETAAQHLSAHLDALIDYATYHFAAEEQAMEVARYPQLAAHKLEHARFARRVVEINTDYHNGRKNLALELLTFMHTWLIAHIKGTDGLFGRFLAAENPGLSKQQGNSSLFNVSGEIAHGTENNE